MCKCISVLELQCVSVLGKLLDKQNGKWCFHLGSEVAQYGAYVDKRVASGPKEF